MNVSAQIFCFSAERLAPGQRLFIIPPGSFRRPDEMDSPETLHPSRRPFQPSISHAFVLRSAPTRARDVHRLRQRSLFIPTGAPHQVNNLKV